MHNGFIYAICAFISLFQLQLIYNRSKKTKYKEIIDHDFCKLLIFFSFFCISDAFWGLCDARLKYFNINIFLVSTYFYHLFCSISAFMWFGYMMKYMNINGKRKIYCNVFRFFLLSYQMILIICNFKTKFCFYISDDYQYNSGFMRLWLYNAEFAYYVIIILISSFMIRSADSIQRKKYLNVFVFSLVPLGFGIGQYLFYDVAMYSMGFMISAFIIYAFNLTDLREKHLEKIAEELNKSSHHDSLTGIFNRRAYEEDIVEIKKSPLKNDFVFISMDLNELKKTNDDLGHEAGDELIKAATNCMLQAFGNFGKVYRVGGDEFFAILNIQREQLKKVQSEFTKNVSSWKGSRVSILSISCGYVETSLNPNLSVDEIINLADERMYREKAKFYSRIGIDRRGQMEAFAAMSSIYKKVLKINLTNDSHKIICMDKKEKNKTYGYSDKISEWLRNFGLSGAIHPDDTENYLQKTSLDFLIEHFKTYKVLVVHFRRRNLNQEGYCDCIMEMIPTSDFSINNMSLYLYVKILDDE